MTERILIQFPPGCYGHFIQWCIEYFGSKDDMPLPFESTGSSHRVRKHRGLTSHNYDDIYKHTEQKIWLSHATFDVDVIAKDFDHVIILHSITHPLWVANNGMTKNGMKPTDYQSNMIEEFHTDTGRRDQFFPLWRSENWDRMRIWCDVHLKIDHNSNNVYYDSDSMEVWQLREKLSFFDLKDILGTPAPMENASQDHSIVIDILLIKEAFTLTIQRIMQFLNKPILKDNFDTVYESWIKQQVHSNKDNMINTICDNIRTNKDFVFDQPLTCLDEIVIQHKLRTKGYEIKCDGLNTFPTTMQQLRDIIV